MPAVDLVALVEDLDHWGPHEENTALLLEHQAYALGLSWTDRTVDPDDPDVAEQRERAEDLGLTPPPFPPVVPMAHRPQRHAIARLTEFADRMAPYTMPSEEPVDLDPDAVLDEWLMANDY